MKFRLTSTNYCNTRLPIISVNSTGFFQGQSGVIIPDSNSDLSPSGIWILGQPIYAAITLESITVYHQFTIWAKSEPLQKIQ